MHSGANEPGDDDEALSKLYRDFDDQHVAQLWTQRGDLMPMNPNSRASPHIWKWSTLLPLAERPGDLVPVGRGGATRLDGELMQSASTDDLVFAPSKLVEDISHIVTVQAGDVIITGTPGGVGHARKPPQFIQDGQVVEVTIEGLGSVRNTTVVHRH